MRNRLIIIATLLLSLLSTGASAKTLVTFYSYTNNCREIVTALTKQIDADGLEIKPTEKGLKYDANGYALGTQLMNAINANPNDASSYPAIDPVTTSIDDYDNIIVVTPLWWSQMAAIMQTFLFNYGQQMAGKNVGLIVSSASSGISGVVADYNRLVPNAISMGSPLWINNGNRSRAESLIAEWVETLVFKTSTDNTKMYITIDGQTKSITLADTQAAKELVARLQNGPVNVRLNSSGDFEIWGALGFSLTTSNQQINAQPGDIVLYNGSNICIFYGTNSWSYTRLGKIDNMSAGELRTFLKAGETGINVTLSLTSGSTGIIGVNVNIDDDAYYSLSGQRMGNPTHGVFIKDGKKIIK